MGIFNIFYNWHLILLVWFRYSILQREKFRRNLELERLEAKRLHDLDIMKLRFFTNITQI